MNKKVPIYGDGRASVYALSEIYDPGRPVSSMQNIAAPTPRVNSLVIDDTIGEHNTLYVVYSVDPETRKCTLIPAKMMNDVDLYDNQIVTYGNNIYMLYWKTTTMDVYERTADTHARTGKIYYARSGDAESGYTYRKVSVYTGYSFNDGEYYERVSKTLWQLTVDQKISVFGTKITKFALYRGANLTEAGDRSLVSDYYLNDQGQAIQTTRVEFDRVTVQATDGSEEEYTTNLKVPKVCYSSSAIENNDVFCLVMYDDEDRVVAQIALMAHDMLGLSELASRQWPIESFTVSANQYDPVDGKCFLVRGQRIDELVFYPQIRYANGDSISDAAIDSTKLLVYGKDEISTAVPGSEYQVLLKYYLSNTEGVADSDTRDYQIGETGRFIYTYTTVKIIAPSESSVSKIAPIPVFNVASGWEILPVVYYRSRTLPRAIGNTSWLASGFTGNYYQNPQTLKIVAVEQDPNSAVPTEFTSSYSITLFDPRSLQDNPKISYTFKDEPAVSNRAPYGSNSVSLPRPRIIREIDGRTATVRHYIPREFFQNVNTFLNAFYYQAEPPAVSGEGTARTPTHFQIRKPDIQANTMVVVTPNPIPIADYGNDLAITDDLSNSDQIPGTCIVEFLYHDSGMANDAYEYLYGVPVDVLKTTVNSQVGDWQGVLYCTYNGFNYILDYTGTNEAVNHNRTWGNSTIKVKAKVSGTTSFTWSLYNASNQLISDGVSNAINLQLEPWKDPSQVEWGSSNVTYMSREPWPNIGDCRDLIYIRVKKHNYRCPYNPQASDAINVRRKWTILSDDNVTIGSIEIGQVSGGGFKWVITITEGMSRGSYSCDTTLQGSDTECPAEVTWNNDPNVTWVSHNPPPVITVEPDVYVEGTKDLPITPVFVQATISGAQELLHYTASNFPGGLTIHPTSGKIYGTPRNVSGEFTGSIEVSSANSNPVTTTVHFTIVNSASYRGPFYAIVDGEKYIFMYTGGNDDVNQTRVWEDSVHRYRLAAVGEFDDPSNNWGWYFFYPDDNGVYHNNDDDWDDYRAFIGTGVALSCSTLDIDPDRGGIELGEWETHMTYFSRIEPSEISGQTAITIRQTVGVPIATTVLNHTAGNHEVCTFTEDPSHPLPGNIALVNGVLSGAIPASGTYTSIIRITAPGCTDAQCTVTFIIDDIIQCHRGPIYVIERNAGTLTYKRYNYASSDATLPAERVWQTSGQNGTVLKQINDGTGYYWAIFSSASSSSPLYKSLTQMNAGATTEPFDVSWDMPTDLLYISSSPTSVISAADTTIDFYKNNPITPTTLTVSSLIGYAPPITFTFTPVTTLTGISVNTGGVVSGSINMDNDQTMTVRITSNITGIAPKDIVITFNYLGGEVYRDPYWLYSDAGNCKFLYTGGQQATGYDRTWHAENDNDVRIWGAVSQDQSGPIYQWYLADPGGVIWFGQEDRTPEDPDTTHLSNSYSRYLLLRSPVGINLVSKVGNVTTQHYDAATKTLTIDIGETVQMEATSTNTALLTNNFGWPTIQANTTDPRREFINVTSSGAITALAGYSGEGDLEVDVWHRDHPYIKETIKIVITIPAPGPGTITASDVDINFTPGQPFSGQATAVCTNTPESMTWAGNSFPAGIQISSSGAISGSSTETQDFTLTATVTAVLNSQTETKTININFHHVADTTFRGTLYTIVGGVERELLYGGNGTETGFTRHWEESSNSPDALVGVQRDENNPSGWMIYWGSGGPQGVTGTLTEGEDPQDQTYTNGYRVTTYRLSDLIGFSGIPNNTIAFHPGYAIDGTYGTVPAANRTAVATSTNTSLLANSFTWEGQLPDGFSINASTGVITGSYTGSSNDATLTGTITAVSTTHSKVKKSWTITFARTTTWSSTITCANPYTINFDTGVAISHTIAATDSGGNTLTFSEISGKPSEITMNSNGAVSGTFNTQTTRQMQIRIASSTATGQPYIDVTVQFVYSATGSNWVGNLYVAGTGFYETMTVPATHSTTVGFERVWTGPNTRIEYHSNGNQWVCTYNGTEVAWGSYANRQYDPDDAYWLSERFTISKSPIPPNIIRATSSDYAGVTDATQFNYAPDTASSVIIGFKSGDTTVIGHGMDYEILTNPASGSDVFTIENLTPQGDRATDPMILRLNYTFADQASARTLVLRVKSHNFPAVYKDFTFNFQSSLVAPTSISATTPVTINYSPSSTISQQLSATANQPSTISYIAVDSVSGITLSSSGLISGRITTTTDQTMRVNVAAANRVGSFISPAAITVNFHYVSDGVFRGSLYVFYNGTEHTLTYSGDNTTLGMSRTWDEGSSGSLSITGSGSTWTLSDQTAGDLATSTVVNTTDDPDARSWTNQFHVYRTAQDPLLTFADKIITYNDGFKIEQTHQSESDRRATVVHAASSQIANNWTYTSADIPQTITMNSSTGVLTGIVSSSSDVVFHVLATNNTDPNVTKTCTVTLRMNPNGGSVISIGLPYTINYESGDSINFEVNATDSAGAPLTMTVSGLPSGLSSSTSNNYAEISGTLYSNSDHQVTITATRTWPGGQPSATLTVTLHNVDEPITPEANYDDIRMQFPNDESIYSLTYVPGSDPDGNTPAGRRWWFANSYTQEYYEFFAEIVATPDGDIVWALEHGTWQNDTKSNGIRVATSSPCDVYQGPVDATWPSGTFASLMWYIH